MTEPYRRWMCPVHGDPLRDRCCPAARAYADFSALGADASTGARSAENRGETLTTAASVTPPQYCPPLATASRFRRRKGDA